MRAGEPADAQVTLAQKRLDHPGRTRLAVRAGYVHNGIGVLRGAEQIHERGDPVESWLEVPLDTAFHDRLLNRSDIPPPKTTDPTGGPSTDSLPNEGTRGPQKESASSAPADKRAGENPCRRRNTDGEARTEKWGDPAHTTVNTGRRWGVPGG